LLYKHSRRGTLLAHPQMLEHVPYQSDTHILHFGHTESHDHMTTLGPVPAQLHNSLTSHKTTLGPA